MKRILMTIYKVVSVFTMVLLPLSCNKFLDEMPDSRTEIDTPEKVSQLLVSAYPGSLPTTILELMSDNVTDYGRQIDVGYTTFEQIYRFEEITGESTDSPADIWVDHYSAIGAANTALQAIEELGGTPDLNPQKGEALLCRAYAHFVLANVFCQAYNSQSSGTDLGIPYVTEPESTVFVNYSRGTVADVYAKIAADIEEGFPLIDETVYSSLKYHFNSSAAAAFAAQFYLYYGDYEKSIEYATIAVGEDPTPYFRDWTLYTGTSSTEYANAFVSTDEVANFMLQGYMTRFVRYRSYRFVMTQGLLRECVNSSTPWGNIGNTSYGTAYVISSRSYFSPKFREYFIYTNQVAGIGYPYSVMPVFTSEKVIIDRAEANALDGDYDAAVRDLNYFYHSLGLPSTLTLDQISSYYDTATTNNPELEPRGITFASATQTNLIKACLHARRIIGAHEGIRTLDLKRYGITIEHELDSEASVIVGPYDMRLAIQLPQPVVAAGLEDNPR